MMSSHYMIGDIEYIIEYKPELCVVKCFGKKPRVPYMSGQWMGAFITFIF